MATNIPIKPFLKWAGGKRQLLPYINKAIPKNFVRYFEPFLGAGALFLSMQPKSAVLNDYNEQLMLTYMAIKNNIDLLIEKIKKHRESNSKSYFYEIRALDRDKKSFSKLTDVEKAARLIYLNKTCYNGLYRVNSKGYFNVPYGKYKNPSIFEEETLKTLNEYLNQADITFTHGDFADSLKETNTGDFVYLDPPYHTEKSNFVGYQPHCFDDNEQIRLVELYKKLSSKGVKLLLSNSATDFIKELYKEFDIQIVPANRTINSIASNRGKIDEVLIKNY